MGRSSGSSRPSTSGTMGARSRTSAPLPSSNPACGRSRLSSRGGSEAEMTMGRKRQLAREAVALGHCLEGGESVNREARGGKNYRDYNGYHELQRKIKQSENRKKHAFAGTSIFQHLAPRKNGVEDMAKDWLEADMHTTQEAMDEETARSAVDARRAKLQKDAAFLLLDHDDHKGKKKVISSSYLDEDQRVRDVSTPDYAYRVLDSKCSWNDKQASLNGKRIWRLTHELERQAGLLTHKKRGMMEGWAQDYDDEHHRLMKVMEGQLNQQDRDRYTRLIAKLKVISQDVDACARGEDSNHGHLDLTLRAMRLSANKSMYLEKAQMHADHPWYFQLLTMLNLVDKPIFSRAEERFIEDLRETAEKNGKLTLQGMMEVASRAQGLDLERDALRIAIDYCLADLGLATNSDEYGLWSERITKKINTIKKPTRRGLSSIKLDLSSPTAATPVPFPGSPEEQPPRVTTDVNLTISQRRPLQLIVKMAWIGG